MCEQVRMIIAKCIVYSILFIRLKLPCHKNQPNVYNAKCQVYWEQFVDSIIIIRIYICATTKALHFQHFVYERFVA